jgi:hypothetical protein
MEHELIEVHLDLRRVEGLPGDAIVDPESSDGDGAPTWWLRVGMRRREFHEWGGRRYPAPVRWGGLSYQLPVTGRVSVEEARRLVVGALRARIETLSGGDVGAIEAASREADARWRVELEAFRADLTAWESARDAFDALERRAIDLENRGYEVMAGLPSRREYDAVRYPPYDFAPWVARLEVWCAEAERKIAEAVERSVVRAREEAERAKARARERAEREAARVRAIEERAAAWEREKAERAARQAAPAPTVKTEPKVTMADLVARFGKR